MSFSDAIQKNPGAVITNVIQPANTTTVPFIIKAIAGQLVHLWEYQDSDGNPIGVISPGGSAGFKGIAWGVNPKTANYTALGDDYLIPVDATAGPVTITLQAANIGAPFGRVLQIVKTDSSANAVTIARAGSDTINGATTAVLSTQYAQASLMSDAVSNWYTAPPVSLAPAVILAPDSSTRNLIQPTADANPGLILGEHSPTQTATLLDLQSNSASLHYDLTCSQAGFDYFKISNANNDIVLQIDNELSWDNTLGLFRAAPASTVDMMLWQSRNAGNTFSPDQFEINKTADLGWSKANAANNLVPVASIVGGFLSNVAGAEKGRLIAQAKDSAGTREGLRIEADGAAARIGFLGANAVVRQTGGAATAGALYTATEQGMLNAAYSALRAYGLLT